MKKEHQKIRLHANLEGLAMWLGAFGGVYGYVTYVGITLYNSCKGRGMHDFYGYLIFIAVLGVPFLCLMLWVLPRFFVMITLSEDCIRYKPLFCKAMEVKWKDWKNIYPATYYHGSPFGVGYYPDFLVLAKRSVSVNELQHVNIVKNDDQILKIRITKRSYKKLASILPPYPLRILEKYYGEKYGEH